MSAARRPVFGAAYCAVAFVSAWLILRFGASPYSWIAALALALPTALLVEGRAESDRATGCLVVALAVVWTLWLRLSYLGAVPPIYNYEGLNFVTFADLLVRGGFPYVPYAWYSHTFYSYIIALVVPLAGSELWAAKIAAAVVSIITIGTTYAATRSAFGYRAAWISAAMMSVSLWHLYASRNGYHHFLMPLLQSLLAVLTSEAARRRSLPLHASAGAVLALALHAYWGLYLLIPVMACFFAWRFAHGGADRGTVLREAAVTALTASLLSAPLLAFLLDRPDAMGYPAASVGSDWRRNLGEILWHLSGSQEASLHAEHAPVLDSFTAAAFSLGLVAALSGKGTAGSAFVLLLLFFNAAGLCLTSANFLYMAALIFPVYALAGNGLSSLLGAFPKTTKGAGRLAIVAGVGAFFFVASQNHRRFFRTDLSSLPLVSPFSEEGAGAVALPYILRDVSRMNVMIADKRPGHDFGVLIDTIDDYQTLGPLRDTRRFHEGLLPIPAWLLPMRRSDLALYLRSSEALDPPLFENLSRFYPGLRIERITAPEPYPPLHAATRIEIPKDDLSKFHDPNGARRYLSIPEDGEAALVFANGEIRDLGQVEYGLHPFPGGVDCKSASLAVAHRKIPLCDVLLSLPSAIPDSAYEARMTVDSPTRYSLRKSIVPETPSGTTAQISHALYIPADDAVLVVAWPYLSLNSSSGAIDRYARLSRHGVVGLERVGQRAAVIFGDGTIEMFTIGALERLSSIDLGGRIISADSLGDRIVALDDDNGLHIVTADGSHERSPLGGSIRDAASVAVSSTGLELLSTRSSEWVSLDSALTERGRRRLGAIYHGWSDIAADDDGFVFIRTWDSPLRTYDPLGRFVARDVFSGERPKSVWRYHDLELDAGWASAIGSRQLGIRGPFESVIHVFERTGKAEAEKEG